MIGFDKEHVEVKTLRMPNPRLRCVRTSKARQERQRPLPSEDIQNTYIANVRNVLGDISRQKIDESETALIRHFLRHALNIRKEFTERAREARFRMLAKRWKRETSHISSIVKRSMNLNYQKIIGMGPSAVPLILGELRRQPDDWFWALHAITGENPVPEESEGIIKKMADAWIQWGRSRNLIGG